MWFYWLGCLVSIKVLKNAKVHSHDTAQQIQFLNNMRYTHSEAMENNNYMNNHYSMFDMLRNCGGLTLIHPNYMTFAKSLMIKLISIIDINEIIKQRSAFCENVRAVMKADESLFAQFDRSKNATRITTLSKKKLYNRIWNKAFNARLGAEKKRFVQEHMGHCTNAATVAFRQSLKVFNKKNSIAAASNFSEEAVKIKQEQLLNE